MCHSKDWRPFREFAPILTEAPNQFSGCLSIPHPDPGNSQEHGNQEASRRISLSIRRMLRHCLPLDMPEVSTELSNKLQVMELLWWAFSSAFLENISERLVIRKDDKGKAFDHMSELFDGLINCQRLVIVWTVLLLSGAGIMWVESQGLQNVAGTLPQRRRWLQYRKRL